MINISQIVPNMNCTPGGYVICIMALTVTTGNGSYLLHIPCVKWASALINSSPKLIVIYVLQLNGIDWAGIISYIE